ncbi:MAG: DUF2284 domain-containing protein [Thermodesulfobacteriota bacterium]
MPTEQATHKRVHVRRINEKLDTLQLAADLAQLVSKARELGADAACILKGKDFAYVSAPIAAAPLSKNLASAHWPLAFPHDPVPAAAKAFNRAVFFRVPTPAGMPDYGHEMITEPAHRAPYEKCYEITQKLESEAFYLGYHLAVGFAAGHCRFVYCAAEKRCAATIKGRPCRHPYKARPSLLAAGLDAAAMAGKLPDQNRKADCGEPLYGIVFVA